MPELKANPKEKTITKWESLAGEEVLKLSTAAIGKVTIKQLSANLAEIITKNVQGGRELVVIRLGFDAGKGGATAETKRAGAATALAAVEKKQPFDPEAKGMEWVDKARRAEGGAWSGGELQERFQLSAANLHRRRKEHRIVFWRDARHAFFYPKWQFTGTGALGPGIEDILRIFKSFDEWRIMRYFLTPRYQLQGKRPLDLLRAGDIENVLSHARTHAEEGSW